MQSYTCQSVAVTDMHTGGEPLRIIESVSPDLRLTADGVDHSLLAHRRDLRDRCDYLRRFVVLEPRGHADMYAALLVRPACNPEADFSVLFLHNEGYSTMCGHAVIALAKYAVVKGLVPSSPPNTAVNIECPCGLVRATYHHGNGDSSDSASFISVPAFLAGTYRDFPVSLGSSDKAVHKLNFDIAFGGAFYIILPAKELNLNIENDPIDQLIVQCQKLKRAVSARVSLTHPDSPDLAFIYGVILTDGHDGELVSSNLCVFADGEVDRSPTGSGVTARMAALSAKNLVQLDGVWRVFRNSKTGSEMLARLQRVEAADGSDSIQSVRVEVSGRAFFTGAGTLTAEAADAMLPGFRVQ